MSQAAAVFLDRDGVLNDAIVDEAGVPHPPAGVEDLRLAEGVEQACKAFRAAGYLLIGITNQPDVARGTTARATVEAINARLLERLPLDAILVCYHDDRDACSCRKPKPGLLFQAMTRWNIDRRLSVMVGDRWKDVEAGRRAGCRTALVCSDYSAAEQISPDFAASTLLDVAEWILQDSNGAV